ncbi:MAG: hypothetical protein LC799_25610, partial [Actinobacteria bacterium]|nr:hypothetical protein [Actinomycetota bacterium]
LLNKDLQVGRRTYIAGRQVGISSEEAPEGTRERPWMLVARRFQIPKRSRSFSRVTLLFGAALLALLMPVATATGGPSEGGFSSDNVKWIRHVPTAIGTAEGGRVFENYFYVTTNQQGLLIFDLKNPEDPELVGRLVLPHQFENEDVSTNGEILLLSQLGDATYSGESVPVSSLYVVDVEDKTNPTVIATVPGAGDHTYDCILDCRWAYSPAGYVVDLRDPTRPKLMEDKWIEATELGNGVPAHDLTEVAPGLVLTASGPMVYLDARKDPVHPKVLAMSDGSRNSYHNVIWPRGGKDKLIMSASEAIKPRCTTSDAMFKTWDASRWKKTKTFLPLDEYIPENGTFTDGSPTVGATWYGCSAHWFEPHSSFHNGGLVAGAFYSHGVRFLDIAPDGKIKEVGYFTPHGGASAAAYWVTDEIVYSVDLNRGIDILKYTGKL